MAMSTQLTDAQIADLTAFLAISIATPPFGVQLCQLLQLPGAIVD